MAVKSGTSIEKFNFGNWAFWVIAIFWINKYLELFNILKIKENLIKYMIKITIYE